MRFRFHIVLAVGYICLMCLQCSSVPRHPAVPDANQGIEELSPAEAHAAEVLSYMMQVVLGQAGNPKYRDDWASRGLGIDLDYAKISEIMGDSAQNKNSLMVYDANILGLSEVLYYYNPRLNQFKGRSSSVSLYPSSEMVALRILLLQKWHRGERIRVGAILDRETLFLDPGAVPDAKDVEETGLRPEEIRFLQDIFSSEPQLFHHLTFPCLVDSLVELGVAEEDARAKTIRAKPFDRGIRCRQYSPAASPEAVKIAILPSLIQEFEFESFPTSAYPHGFRPTSFFTDMVDRLILDIRKSLEAALTARLSSEKIADGRLSSGDGQFERLWEEKVSILLEDERPLVIHPANAPTVVEEICPEADLILILTGKDVYLALDLTSEEVFPTVNRMYIDIMDIRRSQIDSAADDVAEFIMERLFPDTTVLRRVQTARMQ